MAADIEKVLAGLLEQAKNTAEMTGEGRIEAIGLRIAIWVLAVEIAMMSNDPPAKGRAIATKFRERAAVLGVAEGKAARAVLEELANLTDTVFLSR